MTIDQLTADLWPWSLSLAAACLVSWLSYRLGGRAARDTDSRTLRLASAEQLAGPLRQLRVLLRSHGRIQPAPSSGSVAAVYLAWTAAFDRVGHRLPEKWQHIGRSVRAAAGEAFGAVTFADIRPETATEPLAEPDYKWQEYADDYLDYLLAAVLRWGDSTDPRTRELWQYDPWLRNTGRTGPVGANLIPDPWFLRILGIRSA